LDYTVIVKNDRLEPETIELAWPGLTSLATINQSLSISAPETRIISFKSAQHIKSAYVGALGAADIYNGLTIGQSGS
jgi:hypothetical protein